MTRPSLVADIKVKAVLCREFHIPWDQYGSMTVREQNVLVDMLVAEQAEMNQKHPPSSGMERVV